MNLKLFLERFILFVLDYFVLGGMYGVIEDFILRVSFFVGKGYDVLKFEF